MHTLQTLSPDIIWSIIDILLVEDTSSSPPVIIRAGGISAIWRLVACSHSCWRNSSFWTSAEFKSRLNLLTNPMRASRLRIIQDASKTELLKFVAVSSTMITKISIKLFWSDYTDDSVVKSIATCTNLTSLELSGMGIDPYTFTCLSRESLKILECLRMLRFLSLESSGLGFKLKSVHKLIKKNVGLQELRVTGDGISELIDLSRFDGIKLVSLQLGQIAKIKKSGNVMKNWQLRGRVLVKKVVKYKAIKF
jgi:hypothetical protein